MSVARTRHRWLVGLGLAAALAAPTARAVAAPDRLAVLMVADDDGLADNVAEVAISHLAKSGGFELVGARELRGRLPETQSSQSLRACLARPACRTAVGTAASAGRAVIGDIRREGESFRMDFSLADLRTGEVGARFAETIAASDVGLIAATRAGLDQLFAPAAATPVVTTAPPAKPAAAAAPRFALTVASVADPTAIRSPPVAVDLSGDGATASARRASALPYLGGGAAAAAVVSFSAAAVTGYLATTTLGGNNRAEMQIDLERHDRYATTANILLGAGTVFAAAAVVSFYRWRHGERTAAGGGPGGPLTTSTPP
jgi:hypothetical protein